MHQDDDKERELDGVTEVQNRIAELEQEVQKLREIIRGITKDRTDGSPGR